MEEMDFTYILDKATKNFYRYKPEDEEAPLQGTLYLDKDIVEGEAPRKLTVVVKEYQREAD